ncbi:phage virion morphogenesis protein [Candidatus Pacearchaeota archaeon]|nr:phage virion morphogenesis protein [Candidatus Pacearchaeota archaeon]
MKIKVTQNTVTPKLRKLNAELKEPLLRSIGNIGYADILRNFKTQGKNIGESWDSLSPLTLLWRRKGGGSGQALALLSTAAAAFGLHQKLFKTKVELRTNKVVKGVDIARVHDEGVRPYKATPKQRAWFAFRGVFLKKGKKLSIPQRKFMDISMSAIKEVEDLPVKIVRDL